MKKIMMIVTIVALLIGTVSLTVFAEPGMGPGRLGNGFRNGIHRDLNLTLEQQQKLLAIRQDFQKDTLVLRNDLQKKSIELRQLWKADQLNQTAIDAKTKEMNTLRIQMVTKRKAMFEKFKGVLTTEQLKKLDDFTKNRQFGPRGQGRHGKGCWGSGF